MPRPTARGSTRTTTPAARRGVHIALRGLGEQPGIVHHGGIAPLRLDDAAGRWSAARPLEIATSMRRRASSRSRTTPASSSISAPSA